MYETDPAVLATWLDIGQAAQAYGVSERTLRRRLTRGELDAGHVKTAKGREWRIRPPGAGETTVTGQGTPEPAPAATDDTGGPLVPLARVEALLAPIVDERDRLRVEVDRLQEARLEQGRADAETIGRLRGRLEALEAELARLRSDSTPAPPAAATTARPSWQFWRRG